jgi:hypothetical protein
LAPIQNIDEASGAVRVTPPVQPSSQPNDAQSLSDTEDDRPEPSMPPDEGRGKRIKSSRHLLQQFQDFIPGQSKLPSVYAEAYQLSRPSEPSVSIATPLPPIVSSTPIDNHIPDGVLNQYSIVKTTRRNEFGLFKRFQAPEENPFDPEASLKPSDYSNIPREEPDDALGSKAFHPFPNKNAFLLGEWRANDGNGKSRENFASLISIVSSPDWNPSDVHGLNWSKIDDSLASPTIPDDGDEAWLDESAWRTSTINVNIPFVKRCANPGPHPYEVQFRHRLLVPMMKEKLMNLQPEDQFHFVPFQLRWQPNNSNVDSAVYGELYNSPAFLEAFHDLQVRLFHAISYASLT